MKWYCPYQALLAAAKTAEGCKLIKRSAEGAVRQGGKVLQRGLEHKEDFKVFLHKGNGAKQPCKKEELALSLRPTASLTWVYENKILFCGPQLSHLTYG